MCETPRRAGRSPTKDVIGAEVWQRLQMAGVGIGPVVSMIPNFVGADVAAWRLAQHPAWASAQMVKTNPDNAQIPIRVRALYEGRIVYTPVPDLMREFPYLRLDPACLQEEGISFELAATSQGFMTHGERLELEEIESLDFCVVGLVAVGRAEARTGKSGGFADLETGVFSARGRVSDRAPMATTVHSLQLVPDGAVAIVARDTPLDLIATETSLIETHCSLPGSGGVDWPKVRPEKFETIPFMACLRDRMTSGAA
jgi:5-formyltetrahydrofolate cyclo-ligase